MVYFRSLTKKGLFVLFFSLILQLQQLQAAPKHKFNLIIAPGTLGTKEVTLLWAKSPVKKQVYELFVNGKLLGSTGKTNYTFEQLKPNTWYTVKVILKSAKAEGADLNTIRFKTTRAGKVYNILDYGAKADGLSNNAKAIQEAINACQPGGTVYIPEGTFLSGALYLKSDMTLFIAKRGVLKGTTNVEDYLPMILNRFEGWEMKTYASLINAGTLNRNGTYNVKNLKITGSGTIMGGGRKLGEAMTKANGIRSRGRLICLMNCQDVSLSKLTITEPPCWTIHYIYSDNVSCHDLNIITKNIRNGDGIDPDSSTDSYIFNCTFDTGDDCIAIKSGKNPEGFFVAKPTTNVQITHCDFLRGHGISIGSEMSGGVSDVLVQDCKAGNLLHGMQIKGTRDRGGYVKNVSVVDCQLLQITIFSAVNYNNDGEAAPQIPTFENFVFKNIDMTMAPSVGYAIDINGFKEPAHRLKNVSFVNISLPANAKISVKDAEKVSFKEVRTTAGLKPEYVLSNSSDLIY
ncbi:glycoside hydrolase family 28 protein [Pedobacter sp.]|uniref:glycoside hydrolase family 28 protein n=1 Tax=Pedobacter sp. TaxID=1411316 RepID=UPI003BA97354